MTTADRRPIRFRVNVEDPPTSFDLEFGLQDRSGGLAVGTPQPGGAMRFDAEAEAIAGTGGRVRLRGATIHGPSGARFLYLSARSRGTAGGPWLYRMKVPLPELEDVVLHDGDPETAAKFEVRIVATGGGTVRLPGQGWIRTGVD